MNDGADVEEAAEAIADLFDANEGALRKQRDSMRSQGLVGWVLFHPLTGIVLHLYRTLKSADSAVPTLSARHGVSFRVLAVSSRGVAYEHLAGKASRAALDAQGRGIHIPLHGRRIDRRGVRQFVGAEPRHRAAG